MNAAGGPPDFTRNDESPLIRGTVEGTAGEAALVINVRAHIEPERLRTTVEQCLHSAGGDAVQTEIEEIANFAPARPQPTYRFDATMQNGHKRGRAPTRGGKVGRSRTECGNSRRGQDCLFR